ncbi:MAG: transposase [Betaproteobacteria bacterium]|nr:transposase [Betaproteobacteria bacterium]
MKYAFIRDHCKQHAVAKLCRFLQVSRSGYHAWLARPASAHAQADQRFLQAIRQVHADHREAYGAIKTWRTLGQRGIACGKHRVARLRREAGIEARRTSRQRITVEHHKTAAPAPDCCSATLSPSRLITSGWAT